MTDLTAEARIRRAEQIVREQRDPDGEYVLRATTLPWTKGSSVEAFYRQEIERLQRAVVGEPDPE